MNPAIQRFLEDIQAASRPLLKDLQGTSLSLGLRRSARLPVLAALHQELRQPILLLTDRADRALTLAEELSFWAVAAPRLLFPEPAPLFYENAAWGDNSRRERLTALTTLAAYHIPGAAPPATPPILLTTIRALMTRTLPRRDFLKATRTLRRGQQAQIDDLLRSWVALGYENTQMVIASGQFAHRGGILDLWPPAEPQPVRIDFFGDEIDTLRRFDPASQRTLRTEGNLERLLVTPAREFIRPAVLPDGLPEEVSEFYLPLLHSTPASLLDYLPRPALVLFDDLQAIADLANEIEEQAVHMRQESIKDETLPENFPVPYLSWSELQDSLSGRSTLELGYSTSEGAAEREVDLSLADRFTPGPRFGGRLKPVMDLLTERYLAGEAVVIVSRQSPRLSELWAETVAVLDQDSEAAPARTPPVLIEGSLSEGWVYSPSSELPLPRLHLLTDGEIFGWRRPEVRRRARRAAESPEAAYSDLRPGDYVVHVDHGIGRFTGLVDRVVDGVKREYLCVEYADDAQLYVPIHQVDRVSRYVGPDSHAPTLNRLGSPEWRNSKLQVKEAVQEVAQDLLELYARRNLVQGHAFPPDNTWQQELEASFPYVETEDQVRVLAEVKADMESDRPMDRLICGDVGYGKTEVALRAAFKAVNDGRQVALLVPTTVLAQQHYNTFQQRLAAFPVEVEMLSRFRSPQQQREIIQRLREGAVDILIGTHRLLSADVQFKDLGLLIIDEEQRFGVAHKETLKKLRTEVDVLTLTATPIPRTLYMALSGVRDISTINTPPEERLPIITHVGPYSQRMVRQAILREMERGGQVFFVHNRVQTIQAMRKHLEQLVPEARIAVAHGQMPETMLAERMEQFSSGEVDVLLSTSIIESGLDIPSANTLIVDRADTFGLAQLYQLRGRVGRGAQRAYAYFFRHKKEQPTPEGRQRLETIAENTQLGAGFSIAMRDLEIRGTGDILGTRQSGNIATVGFHLYTRLLAQAVRRLRKKEGLTAPNPLAELNAHLPMVNVELPLPISLPDDYVPDKTVRLGLYRRLAELQSMEEISALREEFKDRFGDPPEAVLNLFFQLHVKLLAERAGLSSISSESGQLVLRFPDSEVPPGLPDFGPRLRIGKTALWMPYTQVEDWRQELIEVLERLVDATLSLRYRISQETQQDLE